MCWDLVTLLLTQPVVLSNAPSSAQMNALHLAAAAWETVVVMALVAAGMNVNAEEDEDEDEDHAARSSLH